VTYSNKKSHLISIFDEKIGVDGMRTRGGGTHEITRGGVENHSSIAWGPNIDIYGWFKVENLICSFEVTFSM
jgi:hypothetical protein